MNKNHLIQQTNAVNLSDLISNFNYSDNSFISNGRKNPRDSLLNSKLYNKSPEVNSNSSNDQFQRGSFESNFDNHLKQLNKHNNSITQNNKSEHSANNPDKQALNFFSEMEKKKSDNNNRLFLMELIKEIPEYQEYKEKKTIIEKKLKFTLSIIGLYLLTLCFNLYENRTSSTMYDKIDHIINKNKVSHVQTNAFGFLHKNFKISLFILLPSLIFSYYLYRNNINTQHKYRNIIREKYFNEEIDPLVSDLINKL